MGDGQGQLVGKQRGYALLAVMTLARDPWQPDLKMVAAHLVAVRRALRQARAAGAPAYVLEGYRAEVQRCERLLANPPTARPRRLDELSRRAIIHAFTKGAKGSRATSGARVVGLEVFTGLPLYVPNVPSGLPPEEAECLEAAIWVRQFSEWAQILAGRWKLHEPRHQAALSRVAEAWECSRDEAKLRLSQLGLLEAMASAGDPWRGRVGSGKASGMVEVVPKEAGVIGQLKWLAQEALECAKRALQENDTRVHRPRPEVGWPRDQETGKPRDWPALVTRTRGKYVVPEPAPTVEQAMVNEAAVRERLAEVHEVARGKESEKLDALRRHLRAGCDLTVARRRAARDLGVNENAIDLTLSRLRKRCGL